MPKRKSQVYLDYAATTPVDPRVIEAMEPYLFEKFGNASSLHTIGQESAKAVDRARNQVAKFLDCKPMEVIFTSGATEANNTAIKGVAYALKKYGNPSASSSPRGSRLSRAGQGHIITTKIEHPCVLESCRYLEKQGFKITYLPVYKNGVVKVSDVKKAITKKTILISIMYVNNEIGTIQPIAEIGKLIKDIKSQTTKYSSNSSRQAVQAIKPVFHVDATQAINYLDCNVNRLGVDLMSLSAHKIYGPKGVGALYVRKGTQIEPFVHGGHQEYGVRAGTINHPGIVGFGKAIEILQETRNKKQETRRIEELRDDLIKGILLSIPGTRLNGDKKMRVANNINISFDNVEGESLLILLDFKGIAVSTGSACASGSLEPSHVLMALGRGPLEAHGSIRITLGRFTRESDIKKLLAVLPKAVEKLKKISMG
ncbi:cysteine desulfurase [Patescibacteria group bacterium]|nr:cysteine desulfurase [Patescibacteria group bacterium]MBU4512469.1 cysteine desulfurase [Patescibacteria group bacterium]MCG2692597.1 cysteine desulfurase [Candidatus Parcubacteria bacterium]